MSLQQKLEALERPFVAMAVGIPGCGKTTVLQEVATAMGIKRICPDDIREELTGNAADQSVNTQAWNVAYHLVEKELNQDHSVIVDATHTEAWRRPETIAQYRLWGASAIVAVLFRVPLDVAQQRNTARQRVVKSHVLKKMHEAIQKEPPTLAEGFDQVISFSP
jgi:predicted kinase